MPLSDKKELQNLVFFQKPPNIINKTRPAQIKHQPLKPAILKKPEVPFKQNKITVKPQEEEEKSIQVQGKKLNMKSSSLNKNPINFKR